MLVYASYIFLEKKKKKKKKVQEPRGNFRDRGESLFRTTVKYRHFFAW